MEQKRNGRNNNTYILIKEKKCNFSLQAILGKD